MSQGSSTVPPPPTGDPQTDIQGTGDNSRMDQFRSVISRLSGGGTPAINKALEQHHAEVTANAIRHSETAKRYYGMVAQAKATGNNPLTGKPATPEEMAQWQQMADGAWADYTKIAGKSKQAKPIIQQVGGLLKHITGGGGQQQPGQPGQPGGPQGAPAQQGSQTVPPPPQGASAAQASPQPQAAGGPQATTQGQQTVPPPPQGDLSSQGNIDLYNRPHVKNADGSTSTVRSIGIEEDGQQIVIPTVSPDGKVLSNQDAIQLYKRSGKYLGKFKTQKEADDFAAKLHQQYASGMYDHPAGKATVPPVPTMPEGMEGPTIDKLEKEQDEFRVTGGKREAEESATVTGLDKGLAGVGFTPEQRREIEKAKFGGPGMRAALKMHPVLVADPNDPTRQIPAMQSSVPDENGAFPVFGPNGSVMDNPTKMLPTMLPTERTGEMPVFNPVTNTIEQQPTYSTSHKVAPKGGSGGGGDRAGKPSTGGAGGGGGGGSSKGSPQPGSGGRHGIPMRQFGPLQKQATAIDEARNSLVGDDPQKVGGLAADLGVFKSPQSVKRISEYLALVNTQVANEAKTITGQGPMAAVEWYTTLPQTVIGLQQGALADASKGLSPPEQRFVADYYRALGTIGGMRAATGASSAQWSFNTLRSELPTPGPVTSPEEAARRVHNFIKETNVVAKRNPLLKTVPDVPTGGGEYIYAKGPNGVVHRAKKGTPLRQGFTLVDAPTAAK